MESRGREILDRPKVSVIVPVFNEPEVLLTASLKSLQVQTEKNFECLIIDDSTNTETTLACLEFTREDARFKHIHPEKRLGLAGSLNLGIQQSLAPLIARFDADDLCVPHRLEDQVRFMDQNPDVGVLGGWLEIINARGDTLFFREYPEMHGAIIKKLQYTNSLAHPAVIFRKELIEKHGGYDSSLKFAEDLDLWLRLANENIRFANLPKVLIKYRQNSTHRIQDNWRNNLMVRARNINYNQLHHRVAGILAILIWLIVPLNIRALVFEKILLKK